MVPSDNRGGGLVLFWKNTVNLTVEDSSKYFIDAWIDKNLDQRWRFTGFYGEPETARRHEAWSKLRHLNHHPNVPWVCVGDFNEIVSQEEKVEGAQRPHNPMQLFRDVINECGFMDLGFSGLRFTWSKHFRDDHSIWEKLNRGLANNSFFFLLFPSLRINHLRCDTSYHVLILLYPSGIDPPP